MWRSVRQGVTAAGHGLFLEDLGIMASVAHTAADLLQCPIRSAAKRAAAFSPWIVRTIALRCFTYPAPARLQFPELQRAVFCKLWWMSRGSHSWGWAAHGRANPERSS